MNFNPWFPYSSMQEYLAAQGISLGAVGEKGTVSQVTETNGVTTVTYANGMTVMVGGGNMAITHNGRVYNMQTNVSSADLIAARGGTAVRECIVTADGRTLARVQGETVVNIKRPTCVTVQDAAGVAIHNATNVNLDGTADVFARNAQNANVTAAAVAADGTVHAGSMDVASLESTVAPLEQFSASVSKGVMADLPTVSSVNGKNVINVIGATNVTVQGATVVAIQNATNVNVRGGNAAYISNATNANAAKCGRISLRNVGRMQINGRTYGGGTTTTFGGGGRTVTVNGKTTVTINGKTVTGGGVDVNAILGNIFGGNFGTTVMGGSTHVNTTVTVNGKTVTGGGDLGSLFGSLFGSSFIKTTTTGTTTGTDDILQQLFRIGITVTTTVTGGEGEQEGDFTGTAEDEDAKGKTYSPDMFRGHVYLTSRNRGWCKKLTGKVTLVNLLVDDTTDCWNSEADIRALKRDVKAACDMMHRRAKEYDVKLELHPVYQRVQIQCKAGTTNHDNFKRKLPAALGCNSMTEVHEKFVKQYGGDEVAIIVMPHHSARSFAFMADDRSDEIHCAEYAMVYAPGWSRDRAGTYIHELFHVFGAEDFYYPEDTVRACKRLFPNSIMRRGDLDDYFDPVTRFLIGWTDRLTEKAKQFLEATKHLTRFQVEAARRRS